MRELTEDPFYGLIRKYDRSAVEYCLIRDDISYRGVKSHKRAVLFAMLKAIERYINELHADEERIGYELDCEMFPWSLDIGRAQAAPMDAARLLRVPVLLKNPRVGLPVYDCEYPNVDRGDPIPYWYAFLETPHGTGYTPRDFAAVNAVLFPDGEDDLEAFAWSTDWSSYFDAGHEWWGAACWSVYDRRRDRFIVMFASTTD